MKLVEGVDWYRDPASGNVTWTAAYLIDRGYCCNGGCRHCPYDDKGNLVDSIKLIDVKI